MGRDLIGDKIREVELFILFARGVGRDQIVRGVRRDQMEAAEKESGESPCKIVIIIIIRVPVEAEILERKFEASK